MALDGAAPRSDHRLTMRLGTKSPMRSGVKRGWTDMTALLDKGLSGDDDFAGLLALRCCRVVFE